MSELLTQIKNTIIDNLLFLLPQSKGNFLDNELSSEEKKFFRSFCSTVYKTGDFVLVNAGNIYFQVRARN
jgi:hypothetical protein